MERTNHNASDIVALSYQMQRENFTEKNELSIRKQESWFDETTVDFWRHHRVVVPIKPLLDYYKNGKWLTIGDGRFGLDSIRLKKIQPSLNILPTDIAVDLLKQAKENKLIEDFREENAEALSFGDNSFDFTFCKESFHHFPRPYIALYEMLRVSKYGVILMEPNENHDYPIEMVKMGLRNMVKRIIGKKIYHPETWNFEISGNYIYQLSKLEMEKAALGLQLPVLAFSFSNDYYQDGVEFEKAVKGNKVFEKVKRKIALQDLQCRLGLRSYINITAILFKEVPNDSLRRELIKNNFEFIDLPENPYLKKRVKQATGDIKTTD